MFFLLLFSQHVAVVLKVKGDAVVVRKDSTFALKKGDVLYVEDEIKTGEKSLAVLKFLDRKAIVRVKELTSLRLKKPEKGNRVFLFFGEILNTIKGESFEVETPTSVATVKGTEFMIEQSGDTTRVEVYEGRVVLRNDVGEVEIGEGESGIACKGRMPEIKKLPRKVEIEFENERGERRILEMEVK